jgi:hypothetical protein
VGDLHDGGDLVAAIRLTQDVVPARDRVAFQVDVGWLQPRRFDHAPRQFLGIVEIGEHIAQVGQHLVPCHVRVSYE